MALRERQEFRREVPHSWSSPHPLLFWRGVLYANTVCWDTGNWSHEQAAIDSRSEITDASGVLGDIDEPPETLAVPWNAPEVIAHGLWTHSEGEERSLCIHHLVLLTEMNNQTSKGNPDKLSAIIQSRIRFKLLLILFSVLWIETGPAHTRANPSPLS